MGPGLYSAESWLGGVGVGVDVYGTCCVRWEGWRSLRSPETENSPNKSLRSRCGLDSASYPPLHRSTLWKYPEMVNQI